MEYSFKKELGITCILCSSSGFQKGLGKGSWKLGMLYAQGFVYLNIETEFCRTSANSLAMGEA